MGIDELLVQRRHLGEQPEPAEGVHPLELSTLIRRYRRAADAVVTVAAGDEIAVQLVTRPAMGVAHPRTRRTPVVQDHVRGLPQHGPRLARARLHQVLLQLGLPVDQDTSAGESLEVYA